MKAHTLHDSVYTTCPECRENRLVIASGCRERAWGQWRVTYNGSRVSVLGDEKKSPGIDSVCLSMLLNSKLALKLIVMIVVQLYEYTKNH